MSYSFNHNESATQAVKQNLQQLAAQLDQPHNMNEIEALYETDQKLVSHLSPDPLTLARVAGVLLVYQLPNTDPGEVE